MTTRDGLTVLALASTLVTTAACGSSTESTEQSYGSNPHGNVGALVSEESSGSRDTESPSSDICSRHQAVTSTRTGPSGSRTVCIFGGRTLIDASTLSRGTASQAAERFLGDHSFQPSGGVGNPASLHCTAFGGNIQIMENPETGDQEGWCTFYDGSAIEEWTLSDGIERVGGGRELAAALQGKSTESIPTESNEASGDDAFWRLGAP